MELSALLLFVLLLVVVMAMHISRESSKLWRKISMEISVEIKVLMEKWRFLLAGLVFQYIHGLAARGVHYLHRPGPTLQDLGFMILPELGRERGYISESLFTFIFFSFLLWTFHPFVYHSKRFYTVLLWTRVLAFLVVSQILRIITFYSTQLPGPNYHCRVVKICLGYEIFFLHLHVIWILQTLKFNGLRPSKHSSEFVKGSSLARLPTPKSVTEVLLINFPHGIIYGCGDLIFSSHMIFTLVFVITYHKYGSNRFIKLLAWHIAIIQSLLIIASRKHYTVDVVVAWYTVNLVVYFIDKKLPEMPDRSVGSQPLLPLSVKEKEAKSREEHHKLLNANAVDSADSDREPQ